MDFHSYPQSSWPERVTGRRVKGHAVLEPPVASVCTRCISAPPPALDLPLLSPGTLRSFAAQGWKIRTTVERRVKRRRCWDSRTLAWTDACSEFWFFALFFSVISYRHLSRLIFLEDKAELFQIRSCYQPQKERTLIQRQLLGQICGYNKNASMIIVNEMLIMPSLQTRPAFPTLSIAAHLLVQRKLARIVQNRELLEQSLDDILGGGHRADVDVLHTVGRQVEGRFFISSVTVCSLMAL